MPCIEEGEGPLSAVRVQGFDQEGALSPLSRHFSHALHSHKVSLDPFRKRFSPQKNVKSFSFCSGCLVVDTCFSLR